MNYETIAVKPLSPIIGAEIEGTHLGKPLDDLTFEEVHDALMRHQVIFFRNQEMTLDEHKAFGRRFGELHVHPAAPSPEGHPEILRIHADETSKRVAGHGWHSDVSCDAEPPLGSILHRSSVSSCSTSRPHSNWRNRGSPYWARTLWFGIPEKKRSGPSSSCW